MNQITLGQLIKEKRLEQGFKQSDFACKIGMSRSYLSDIENDRYTPSVKLLFELNKELRLFIFITNDGNTIHIQKGGFERINQ